MPAYGRSQQLAVVAQHLDAVEKSSALRNGPDHYARALESAGDQISGNAVRAIEARGQSPERVSAELGDRVRSARLRRDQDWWVWGAAGIGLAAGVLLTLFLLRVLAGSVDMAVASTAMSADGWNAGISLMQSGSPQGWRGLVDASNLVRANKEALTACAEAAAKAKKDQRCTIAVAGPQQ